MKTILVTGGAGLIGSCLTRRLVNLGERVVVFDNLSRGNRLNLKKSDGPGLIAELVETDLTDNDYCKEIFNQYRFDEVYHLAAYLGGVDFIHKHPVEAFSRNMSMNLNVLYYCNKQRVPKVLFTSTACVYPVGKQTQPNSAPLKEEDVFPLNPESGYGWAKYMTEMLCMDYLNQYQLNSRIVRMFNVYGPGEKANQDSHVIPMLIRKAIEGTSTLDVWGSGRQTRSFIYVEDAVDGILKVMNSPGNFGPVNIGTAERVSIDTLSKYIIDISGKNLKIVHNTSMPEGVVGRSANCALANSLGWNPKTNLKTGLEITYKWMDDYLKSSLSKQPYWG